MHSGERQCRKCNTHPINIVEKYFANFTKFDMLLFCDIQKIENVEHEKVLEDT